ncbi:hypothetical protein IQ249_05540 [Lusitaniella coriacea LEGE 07157]|uniref:MnmC-like methyltransferase domain-containing protein n=1 Tax=Lusitaniella coriacea LEGE 07157 TaxID=945747 RepID=A0A8J7DNY3_9CYAN|nr:hypothetical protein [Lusitaniella coriacea LEGE 07157]
MTEVTFTPQPTADGSFTFFSPEFEEAFHSHFGARREAEEKFVEPCRLKEIALSRDRVQILDICYGLGYNSAAALHAIGSVNPHCRVELIALECNRLVPQCAIARDLLQQWNAPIPSHLKTLAESHRIQTPTLDARLLIGDARTTLQQVHTSKFQADAIFLDPFSPPKCPQLWTVEFLQGVVRCLKPTGILATYSSAAATRATLVQVGLHVGSTPSTGRRSPGTVASFDPQYLPPLSQREREHLQTRAATPYRDPQLNATAEEILKNRDRERQASPLEPTTRWKRRWRTP